jgi:hypothetical protein
LLDLPRESVTLAAIRNRVTYTVKPRMFVSGIVQYNSTTNSVGSNLRLRGNTVQAANSSSFIPTTTTAKRAPTSRHSATARSS